VNLLQLLHDKLGFVAHNTADSVVQPLTPAQSLLSRSQHEEVPAAIWNILEKRTNWKRIGKTGRQARSEQPKSNAIAVATRQDKNDSKYLKASRCIVRTWWNCFAFFRNLLKSSATSNVKEGAH
jgi:hypothetical protein